MIASKSNVRTTRGGSPLIVPAWSSSTQSGPRKNRGPFIPFERPSWNSRSASTKRERRGSAPVSLGDCEKRRSSPETTVSRPQEPVTTEVLREDFADESGSTGEKAGPCTGKVDTLCGGGAKTDGGAGSEAVTEGHKDIRERGVETRLHPADDPRLAKNHVVPSIAENKHPRLIWDKQWGENPLMDDDTFLQENRVYIDVKKAMEVAEETSFSENESEEESEVVGPKRCRPYMVPTPEDAIPFDDGDEAGRDELIQELREMFEFSFATSSSEAEEEDTATVHSTATERKTDVEETTTVQHGKSLEQSTTDAFTDDGKISEKSIDRTQTRSRSSSTASTTTSGSPTMEPEASPEQNEVEQNEVEQNEGSPKGDEGKDENSDMRPNSSSDVTEDQLRYIESKLPEWTHTICQMNFYLRLLRGTASHLSKRRRLTHPRQQVLLASLEELVTQLYLSPTEEAQAQEVQAQEASVSTPTFMATPTAGPLFTPASAFTQTATVTPAATFTPTATPFTTQAPAPRERGGDDEEMRDSVQNDVYVIPSPELTAAASPKRTQGDADMASSSPPSVNQSENTAPRQHDRPTPEFATAAGASSNRFADPSDFAMPIDHPFASKPASHTVLDSPTEVYDVDEGVFVASSRGKRIRTNTDSRTKKHKSDNDVAKAESASATKAASEFKKSKPESAKSKSEPGCDKAEQQSRKTEMEDETEKVQFETEMGTKKSEADDVKAGPSKNNDASSNSADKSKPATIFCPFHGDIPRQHHHAGKSDSIRFACSECDRETKPFRMLAALRCWNLLNVRRVETNKWIGDFACVAGHKFVLRSSDTKRRPQCPECVREVQHDTHFKYQRDIYEEARQRFQKTNVQREYASSPQSSASSTGRVRKQVPDVHKCDSDASGLTTIKRLVTFGPNACPWAILGVSPPNGGRRRRFSAQDRAYLEAKLRFKQWVRKVHPDKNSAPNAKEAFHILDTAWKSIDNQVTR